MRFFILLCLASAAHTLGYNYQAAASSNAARVHAQTGAAPSNAAPVAAQTAAALAAQFEKKYYTFYADDSDFQVPAASEQIANSLKKNLRVVFIKGPEQSGLEDAALALAKEAAEQKTAIYVLNKLANIGELANKLNAASGQRNNKPEVHFVKYRTLEDAANAQHAIQSQYDSLGGSSQSHNAGEAPVLNFASHPSAPTASHSADATAPSLNYVPAPPSDSFLPASIFRSLRA